MIEWLVISVYIMIGILLLLEVATLEYPYKYQELDVKKQEWDNK